MKIANIVSGIIILAISASALIMISEFPNLQGSITGPGSFPKAISIILIILAITLIVQSIFFKKKDSEPQAAITPSVIAMGMIFIYLLAIQWIGFFIATPLVVAAFLFMSKIKNWIIYTCIPLGLTLFVYYLFQILLSVPLPSGNWFS